MNTYKVAGGAMMLLGLLAVLISIFASSISGFGSLHVLLVFCGLLVSVIGFAIVQKPE